MKGSIALAALLALAAFGGTSDALEVEDAIAAMAEEDAGESYAGVETTESYAGEVVAGVRPMANSMNAAMSLKANWAGMLDMAAQSIAAGTRRATIG